MTEPRPHRAALRRRAGRGGARRGGAARDARPRRGRRRARGGRPTRPAAGAPRGADRARGRGRRACWRAACRPSRSPARSGSRSRPPTATSRTPTARSASRPAPRRRCSPWSTGSRMGRTPDGAPAAALLASSSKAPAEEVRDDRASTIHDAESRRRSRPPGSAGGPNRGGPGPGARVDGARAGRRARATPCSSSPPASATPASTPRHVLGERGRLISSDFSPGDARRRSPPRRERGVGNVDYRIVDAERIELAEDAVDGVLCRFGYMLMDDPGRARRDPPRAAPGRPAGARGLGRARAQPVVEDRSGSPSTCAAISRLPSRRPRRVRSAWRARSAQTELLHAAGFTKVRTEEVPVRMRGAGRGRVHPPSSGDTAGPLALALRGLSRGRPCGPAGGRPGLARPLHGRERPTSCRASRCARWRAGAHRPMAAVISRTSRRRARWRAARPPGVPRRAGRGRPAAPRSGRASAPASCGAARRAGP